MPPATQPVENGVAPDVASTIISAIATTSATIIDAVTLTHVPKRTNDFQEVVSIIYEHMAGDAVVEKSGYLPHRVGGEREVDVVIRSKVAGHEVILSVEAADRGRKADSTWVEQLVAKHRNLPTSRLVLVSESGFYDPARKLAEAENAVPLAPEDLDADDPALGVVGALRSLWPKELRLIPEEATLVARRPDGTLIRMEDVKADLGIFLADGQAVGTLTTFLKLVYDANFPTFAETVGLANMTEDTERGFVFSYQGPLVDDTYLYLRMEEGDTHELLQIQESEFRGKAIIHVCEIPLHHKRLGEVTCYASGEGTLGDEALQMVVSEGKATIRSRPGP